MFLGIGGIGYRVPGTVIMHPTHSFICRNIVDFLPILAFDKLLKSHFGLVPHFEFAYSAGRQLRGTIIRNCSYRI